MYLVGTRYEAELPRISPLLQDNPFTKFPTLPIHHQSYLSTSLPIALPVCKVSTEHPPAPLTPLLRSFRFINTSDSLSIASGLLRMSPYHESKPSFPNKLPYHPGHACANDQAEVDDGSASSSTAYLLHLFTPVTTGASHIKAHTISDLTV